MSVLCYWCQQGAKKLVPDLVTTMLFNVSTSKMLKTNFLLLFLRFFSKLQSLKCFLTSPHTLPDGALVKSVYPMWYFYVCGPFTAHCVMRKWILLNDLDDSSSGAKGYLKVSLFVVGTGDDPPVWPMSCSSQRTLTAALCFLLHNVNRLLTRFAFSHAFFLCSASNAAGGKERVQWWPWWHRE